MYKDRHMHKRIGGKMVKLDPVIIQESGKEIRAGKTQPSLKVQNKSNNLAVFSYGRASPNAGRHWTTDSDGKKPCWTKDSKSDLEHLVPSLLHGLALQLHSSPWSLSWGPSGNLRIASRAYTGGNPRAIAGSKGKQELWIWEVESEKIDLQQ